MRLLLPLVPYSSDWVDSKPCLTFNKSCRESLYDPNGAKTTDRRKMSRYLFDETKISDCVRIAIMTTQ
ncbi:7625_t:CDS:2, partial [Cetraspora pellucida]